MVEGPEIARITTEFEEQAIEQNNGSAYTGQHHHDQQLTWSAGSIPEGCYGTCESTGKDGESISRTKTRPTSH